MSSHTPPRPASDPSIDWAQYDRHLSRRARESLLYLVSVAPRWQAVGPARRARGRPVRYSGEWILALLLLRTAHQLTLRETVAVAKLFLAFAAPAARVPSYSHLAARARALCPEQAGWQHTPAGIWVTAAVRALDSSATTTELWVALDSTGHTLRGPHSWRSDKPGTTGSPAPRRTFAKEHRLIDLRTNAILAVWLTAPRVADGTALPLMLQAVVAALPPPWSIRVVAADGAYDTRANYAACASLGVTHTFITPKARARRWPATWPGAGLRNAHFGLGTRSTVIIPGSRAWRLATGAGIRSLVETSFSSSQSRFGGRLRCRSLAGQATEVWCRTQVQNAFTLEHPCPTRRYSASMTAMRRNRPIAPPLVTVARVKPRIIAPLPVVTPQLSPTPWNAFRRPRRHPLR